MLQYKKLVKISYKNEKIELKWLQNGSMGHTDERSIKSRTEPHTDFVNAFRALDEAICKESELPLSEDEYKRHDIQVVNLKYEQDDDGNDVMFASITSERFMAESETPMTITSPMKPESKSLGLPLDSKSVEAIDKVIQEASAYIEGKRHDLFSMTNTQMEVIGN